MLDGDAPARRPPRAGRAVELRNPYVDALCYLQLRALRTLRTDDSPTSSDRQDQAAAAADRAGRRRRPAEHRLMFGDLDRPPLDVRFLRGRLMRPGALWTPDRRTGRDGVHQCRRGRRSALWSPEGLVVAAEYQSSGRGRLGRTWTTPPRSALLMSALLRPAPFRLRAGRGWGCWFPWPSLPPYGGLGRSRLR